MGAVKHSSLSRSPERIVEELIVGRMKVEQPREEISGGCRCEKKHMKKIAGGFLSATATSGKEMWMADFTSREEGSSKAPPER